MLNSPRGIMAVPARATHATDAGAPGREPTGGVFGGHAGGGKREGETGHG